MASRRTDCRQLSQHCCCRSLNKKVAEHSSASERACSVKAEEQDQSVLDTFTRDTGDVRIDVADDTEIQHQSEGQTAATASSDDPGVVKTRSGKRMLHAFARHAYDAVHRMTVVPIALVSRSAHNILLILLWRGKTCLAHT